MRTEKIYASNENHPGYGAGDGDTERYEYKCPCGKGKIVEEHDNIHPFFIRRTVIRQKIRE